MGYLSRQAIEQFGFKSVGDNVKISDRASVYNPETIEIGNHSRIDDFCVVSGNISLGDFVYVGPFCLLAGGEQGITMEDFSTLAYGVKLFSQSDDYTGRTLTNPTVDDRYKQEIKEAVHIGRHVIIGASSVVFPGVEVTEGCSVGAMTLVNKSTKPWGIYVGNPARRLKERKKDLLNLESKFLQARG